MKDKILVIGGYGNVGKIICRDLGEKFPGKVIAAGRSFEKVKKITQTTNGNVLPLKFDLFNTQDNKNLLEDVSTVVMCLDQTDTKFIEECIKMGVNYIDITASYDFFSKIQTLHTRAKKTDSTIVMSVGLSPGLTNLMVKYSKSHLDILDNADINLMLGIGDGHGKAAIEWMVDNMNTKFNIIEKGKTIQVKSLEDGKSTKFPKPFGDRYTYRFDFAEQHGLPETLNIKSVSNRICFDSRFVTHFLVLLKKIGLLKTLKLDFFRKGVINLLKKSNMGSDIFIAKVDALGKKNGVRRGFECFVRGKREGEITGKVAAIVAEYIYREKYPSGTYHIEEIFSLEEIIERIDDYIDFHRNYSRI